MRLEQDFDVWDRVSVLVVKAVALYGFLRGRLAGAAPQALLAASWGR